MTSSITTYFLQTSISEICSKRCATSETNCDETAAGAITIAPGANQTVNTHAGNVTTYADKLVIKRNGSVVTTFTRRNNTSPWVKEASATTVAGIAGTNNGITVAAGTFNPADTIQVVATQGSGETISDEQRSDDFTVVAPQPNEATTKIGKMVILISRLIIHQDI